MTWTVDRQSPRRTDSRRALSPHTRWAARLVEVQVGCSHDEAFSVLRERADALGYRLDDYARLVVEGIVRFDK